MIKPSVRDTGLVMNGAVQLRDRMTTGSPDVELPLKGEWVEALATAISSGEQLRALAVPARKNLIGDWFKEGDLGFIYGARGLGKTWLAMLLARRMAEGESVATWTTTSIPVLYVDGEMALDDLLSRDQSLTKKHEAPLTYIQHEALFHKTGKVLNLTLPAVQAALSETCKQRGTKVLILDNLSCLFCGIRENDANDWELVLPWLLELRRNGIAVVFVAHAGRNGFMRGTSRREDAAFWVIQITPAEDAGSIQEGARFVARFAKNRNSTEASCPPLEWQFHKADQAGEAHVTWRELSTLQLFRQWIEEGLTSASEIADEMGISKGQVSKLAKKAIAAGWLAKEGREYKVAARG